MFNWNQHQRIWKPRTHSFMKILLRHIPTSLYVQAVGRWTARREKALVFSSVGPAVRFARRKGLQEMQLVFLGKALVAERAKYLEGQAQGGLGLVRAASAVGPVCAINRNLSAL